MKDENKLCLCCDVENFLEIAEQKKWTTNRWIYICKLKLATTHTHTLFHKHFLSFSFYFHVHVYNISFEQYTMRFFSTKYLSSYYSRSQWLLFFFFSTAPNWHRLHITYFCYHILSVQSVYVRWKKDRNISSFLCGSLKHFFSHFNCISMSIE